MAIRSRRAISRCSSAQQGQFNATLAPNAGAMPAGTYYRVTYKLNDGTTNQEFWVVPATQTTTIGAIRSTLAPANHGGAVPDAHLGRRALHGSDRRADRRRELRPSPTRRRCRRRRIPMTPPIKLMSTRTAEAVRTCPRLRPSATSRPTPATSRTLTVQTTNGIPNPAEFSAVRSLRPDQRRYRRACPQRAGRLTRAASRPAKPAMPRSTATSRSRSCSAPATGPSTAIRDQRHRAQRRHRVPGSDLAGRPRRPFSSPARPRR